MLRLQQPDQQLWTNRAMACSHQDFPADWSSGPGVKCRDLQQSHQLSWWGALALRGFWWELRFYLFLVWREPWRGHQPWKSMSLRAQKYAIAQNRCAHDTPAIKHLKIYKVIMVPYGSLLVYEQGHRSKDWADPKAPKVLLVLFESTAPWYGEFDHPQTDCFRQENAWLRGATITDTPRHVHDLFQFYSLVLPVGPGDSRIQLPRLHFLSFRYGVASVPPLCQHWKQIRMEIHFRIMMPHNLRKSASMDSCGIANETVIV